MQHQMSAALTAVSVMMVLSLSEAAAGDKSGSAQSYTATRHTDLFHICNRASVEAAPIPLATTAFQVPCDIHPAAWWDAMLYDYFAAPIAGLMADPIGALAVGIRLAIYEFSVAIWAGGARVDREADRIDGGLCLVQPSSGV